jgi:hypothetical protein
MPIRTNRLLALLLTLVLALGPTGGVWAANHACGAGDGRAASALAGHAGHHQPPDEHAAQAAVSPDGSDSGSCGQDFCSTQSCSAHACGFGIAILRNVSASQPDLKELTWRLESQIALSKRPALIYRPPRA